MAGTTTYLGITYPTSTDYVKDGASAMQTIATGFDTAVAIPTYNSQTGTTYTFALSDVGKTVTASNASSSTYTIPPQASVVWPTGATLNIVNLGAGVVTIAAGAGVTVTNSAQTLSQYQSAALVRTASNAWTVVPFVGGVATLADSAISGTTGSPTTATYTSGGFNYKTYRWTGTGSLTLTRAGVVDVFLVGGGGGSGFTGGGGAGGAIIQQSVYLAAGTCGVIVGAGGATKSVAESPGVYGGATSIGVGTNVHTYIAIGGGGGGSQIASQFPGLAGVYGASGGGGAAQGTSPGVGGGILLTGLGNIGGNGVTGGGSGGGGGFSSAGANGSGANSGAGGNGLTSTFFDGSTGVAYAGGGGGGSNTIGANGSGGGGTANTGGGGRNSAGGSGLVMIRVLQ